MHYETLWKEKLHTQNLGLVDGCVDALTFKTNGSRASWDCLISHNFY